MADVQEKVNEEVARDLPLIVKFLFFSIAIIVGASLLGYVLHSIVASVK